MTSLDFKIVFNEDFNRKISELVFYINYKFCNPSAGKKLIDNLISKANSLSSFPERHPVMQVEKPSGIVVRKFIVDKYLITYFIDTKNKKVFINNLLTSK